MQLNLVFGSIENSDQISIGEKTQLAPRALFFERLSKMFKQKNFILPENLIKVLAL